MEGRRFVLASMSETFLRLRDDLLIWNKLLIYIIILQASDFAAFSRYIVKVGTAVFSDLIYIFRRLQIINYGTDREYLARHDYSVY